MYKHPDGSYTEPQMLSRSDAIEIANQFARAGRADSSFLIPPGADEFIFRKAMDLGLVTKEPARSGLLITPSLNRESEAADGAVTNPVSPRPEFKPRYFPELSSGQTPNITNELVETIAFILAGVDPAQRRDSNALRSRMTLRQLVHVATAKVSTNAALRSEHRYLLVHLWQLPEQEFNDAWENAQSQAKGQDNTDTIKLLQRFEKLELDDQSSRSLLAVNGELFQQIREKSVDMLVRIVRRARRTITSYHEEVQQPPRQSILQRLGLFRASASSTPLDVVPIEPVVLKSAEEYVYLAIKLGRILRIDSRKPTSG